MCTWKAHQAYPRAWQPTWLGRRGGPALPTPQVDPTTLPSPLDLQTGHITALASHTHTLCMHLTLFQLCYLFCLSFIFWGGVSTFIGIYMPLYEPFWDIFSWIYSSGHCATATCSWTRMTRYDFMGPGPRPAPAPAP